jgi:DNA polymerase-3 subunit alpha (Gram-positive type)
MVTWDEFCRQHQIRVRPRLEWDPASQTLHVELDEAWPANLKAEATLFLQQALGLSVLLRDPAWTQPNDRSWTERVLEADSPLKFLLGRGDIRESGGVLTIRFPAPGSRQVFDSWGGIDRLRELVPNLPPVTLENGQLAELGDEVVAVTLPPPLIRFGRDGGLDKPVCPLTEVPEAGTITVAGRIFRVERRQLRDGSQMAMVGLTDGHDSLELRLVSQEGQPWPGADLEPGLAVRARGRVEQDRSGEPVLRVTGLVEDKMPALEDGHPEPRVEWHLHTKMSAMDGVLELEDAIALAARLGHPAVAVTDHGGVQAYPEAERLGARHHVRILYGLEAYAVPDRVRLVTGAAPPDGGPLEWSVVAVDLETTGLSPRVHDIVEIGAVRIEGGEVVDRFHTMVRPARRGMSAEALRITGLRPGDLEAAPSIEDAMAQFRQFARDAVLVAHNAAFDLGFLRPWLEGEPPVVDTLWLARALLPEQKSYGLDPLAQFLKVPLEQHHRALHDAEAAGRVFVALLATDRAKALSPSAWRGEVEVAATTSRPVPVLIYPRHQEAVVRLYEAVSDAHLRYFHRHPRFPWSLIEAHREDWLIASPVNGGELTECLLRGASEDEWDRVQARYDFWEVAPPGVAGDLVDDGELASVDAVQDLMRELVARGQAAGKPVVAVSDAHYLRPEDRIYRDILAATAKSDLHGADSELHFRTTQEMLEEMAFLGPDLAEDVTITQPRRLMELLTPIRPVPEGLHAPVLPEAEQVVSELPWERAREDFGENLPDLVRERLEREIGSILRHGFASVYYTAHRLVEKSLEDGYLVGSRGSVGSSLVATYLHITEVNPLPPHYRCPECHWSRFFLAGEVASGFDLPPESCPECRAPLVANGQDIPFETFLGFEGDKVPDIDLNFSGEYQPVIHRYTEELFGRGQVYRAGTIATIADRTAYGLVKAWAREQGRELRAVEAERLANGLVGVKRTTGQHPGGLMVVPKEEQIHRFTPVQRPADATDADVITTHFDYHAIEGRLLKLDLLGHEDPTTLRMLEDLTGVSPSSVPFQDQPTLSLFSGTEALGLTPEQLGSPVGTLGLPEFGTPFVRRMLVDTRPQSFGELVRISGLSHGTNVWANNAEELIRRGEATLAEVIATRDDIMTYLIRQGLPPIEAFQIMEKVRRGRGLTPAEKELMGAHGVPNWYIDSCIRITYMFPKAHAAAYVTMGWRIAWFKVHYPLAFYAVYCSMRAADFLPDAALGGLAAIDREQARIQQLGYEATAKDKGHESLLDVLKEMTLRGFGFLPVSLMESDAERFRPVGDRQLLMPFLALPGLGRTAAHNILEARADGPFLSVEDLRERARLTKPVLDLLRQYGALDGLGETRQLALF